MCGIAGVFLHRSSSRQLPLESLEAMERALLHRGPDGGAVWVAPDRTVGLVHRRLAIVDLSEAASQPMSSADGRYHLVFNGEIYNHLELRRGLEARGCRFISDSDTEVLLKLFIERGPACLDLLDGMFAFAIHDSREHTLFCARDPMGEKPLYYAARADAFAFASEVRALVKAGFGDGGPSLEGLGLLLRHGSIPAPYTHVNGIRMLPPGHLLALSAPSAQVHPRRYWQLPMAPESTAIESEDEALELVRAALHTSVSRRLRSDVPVGAFLSGGIDSSLVCALMQAAGAKSLATFTVTQPGQPGDEAQRAREIAQRLGTRHHEIALELDARGDWLDEALDAMDVPSVDGPNTWLVSRAVRQAGFKVACTGLGGDELFFGYPSFRTVPRAAAATGWLNRLRPYRGPGRAIARRLPAIPRVGRAADALLAGGTIAALWLAKRGLFSEAEITELLHESIHQPATHIDPVERLESLGCPEDVSARRMVSFYELSSYMADQLLRDTDAASMAHGLEVRAPLIGRSVVETVAALSDGVLNAHGPKWLLRDVLASWLPAELFQHPKQGFTLNWPHLLTSRPALRPRASHFLWREGAVDRELTRLRQKRTGFARYFALISTEVALGKLGSEATARFAG